MTPIVSNLRYKMVPFQGRMRAGALAQCVLLA